jgi:uncharacterized protein (DUF1778 family)
MPKKSLAAEDRHDTSIRARVPLDIKRRWQSAAVMRGQTLTDFLIVAANKATAETFLENEQIELSQRAQIQFAEMLLSPPQSNEAMTAAIKKCLAHMEGE